MGKKEFPPPLKITYSSLSHFQTILIRIKQKSYFLIFFCVVMIIIVDSFPVDWTICLCGANRIRIILSTSKEKQYFLFLLLFNQQHIKIFEILVFCYACNNHSLHENNFSTSINLSSEKLPNKLALLFIFF